MPLARAPLPVLVRPLGLVPPPRLVALLVRAPLPVLVRPLGLARPPRLVVLPVRAPLLVPLVPLVPPMPLVPLVPLVRAPLLVLALLLVLVRRPGLGRALPPRALRPVPGRGRPWPGLRALCCRCRS